MLSQYTFYYIAPAHEQIQSLIYGDANGNTELGPATLP